ncbi:dihydroxyacetone kinase phosphoryl donor subunit DhaM [Terasakiella sp. A23]|uniref:dihydroxyacetone kinase phosphoryl donor subunit DhaM n=1 Tax=Terasakiella sp. FCG-A23 TaxID=3080561 RepID=UPI00295543ED|nr:dihydroxyacetone kinase phosphoryl donor subunit DhaM [Terasakiella sp. A23]MDV7341756.1 dihydroxyacetone kinase phosphoryl donor subunit DhaM [Terasakiella sp. A23]
MAQASPIAINIDPNRGPDAPPILITRILPASHSLEVSRGTSEMVRQMVGDDVQVAYTGGNKDGHLGSDVGLIMDAIKSVYSDKGVVILVDLGGSELNSEMAIEMLSDEQAEKIRICNAPLVEGAVMAATEASNGSSLEKVCETAEGYL